jgi:serine-type D-Ala-D-Ala carboxypeptidase/endopeptidase (penicillin-binding protein 4)
LRTLREINELKLLQVNIRIFIGILFFIGSLNLEAQKTHSKAIKEFISDPKLSGSSIGIYVIDAASGKVLASENSQQLMAPASTLKLVTSAAALEMLGPEYRFKTELGYTGQLQKESQLLEGNLVIRGGGDPTLGSAMFENIFAPDDFIREWISALKKDSILKITGDLIMDVAAFEGNTLPGTWAWEDLANYYGAVPSALTVFDNQVKLSFDSSGKPGDSVRLVRIEPDIPMITWKNSMTSAAGNRDNANIFGSPWDKTRVISGTIPAGRKNYEIKASLPDPPALLGIYVKDKLSEAGIELSGNVIVTDRPQTMSLLSTHLSPPLSQIIAVLNHESVNLFADHLVLQIALEKTGKGNLETGLQLIKSFWKENGVRDTFFTEDGSGLSRYDAISAAQLTTILQFMIHSKDSSVFRSSLPEAGKGTLTSFKTADFPGKTLQCKSGSLSRVRGYGGYLKCDSGREAAFAVLVNNYLVTSAEMGKNLQRLLAGLKKEL